jgi:osmoprotectant transport system ATP-binding protein
VTIDRTAQTEGPPAYPQAASLELRNLRKQYPGAPRPAIEDLSLVVPAGEVCVLVGPSGCGKTTALRLVNRLIEPSAGDVLLDGESVLRRPPAELRRQIGYAIQQVGLFPHQTIAQNVATVPRLLGWPRRRIEDRVAELMELVSLPAELAGHYPAQLSGGQRQRVGVARALAADPPLLLMDEPFGAIDPINRARLQDELLDLQRRVRKTILFVTHDVDEAIKLGDRIAILREGGVLAQYATPDELLAAPADEFVARFVGADRGLKRLSLSRVADLPLLPADGEHGATVPLDTSLRDALSLLISDGDRPLAVLDGDGRVAGLVSLQTITEALQR